MAARTLIAALAALLCAAPPAARAAAALPATMGFIAREAGGPWAVYRIGAGGRPERIATELEPHHACVATAAGKLVYAAEDGSIRLKTFGGGERVLATSDAKASFVQPCLSADGRFVYAVEMKDAKSIETDIVDLSDPAQRPAPVLAVQTGSQMEPFAHARRWLVYGSVTCSGGCDRMMEEVWLRDLVGGRARQITLLHSVSQGPVTDGSRVVFSNNAEGPYKLYEVRPDGSGLAALTGGPDNDLSPALCGGTLYFVRSAPGGATLMRRRDDGGVEPVPLPGLAGFRSLRCIE